MKKQRNILHLRDCYLFAIDSPKDLVRRLSTKSDPLSEEDLRSLAKDAGNFKLFKIGKRPIQEPKHRLQRIHRRIHKLLSRVAVPDYLHSAVRGRSYVTNASAHESDVAIVKVDIKKFFASVPRSAVLRFFRTSCRCRSDVAQLLADLLTFEGKIPTGSSASPVIAFYAFKPMFDEISALAESLGVKFTCYVDDMTFSGISADKQLLAKVRAIIARHGLKSHKVRKFAGRDPKVITGVCVTPNGDRVPNKLHQNIAADFEVWAAQDISNNGKVAARLLGRLEAAGRIEPAYKARAATLRARLKGM